MAAISTSAHLKSAVKTAVGALMQLPNSEVALRILSAYPRLHPEAWNGLGLDVTPVLEGQVGRAVESLRALARTVRSEDPERSQSVSQRLRHFGSVRCMLLCRYLRHLLEQDRFGAALEFDEHSKWQAVALPDPVSHQEVEGAMQALWAKLSPEMRTEELWHSLRWMLDRLTSLSKKHPPRDASLNCLVHALARFAQSIEDLDSLEAILDVLVGGASADTPEALGQWSWRLHCLVQDCTGIGAILCRDPLGSYRMDCMLHRREMWRATVPKVMQRCKSLMPQHGMSAAPDLDPNNDAHLRALQALIGPLEALDHHPPEQHPEDAWPEVCYELFRLSHTAAADAKYWGQNPVCWRTFLREMGQKGAEDQKSWFDKLQDRFNWCWRYMSEAQHQTVIQQIVEEYHQRLILGTAEPLDPCHHLPLLLSEILRTPPADQKRAELLQEWQEICVEMGIDPGLSGLEKVLAGENAADARAGSEGTDVSQERAIDRYPVVQKHLQKVLQQYNVELFRTFLRYSTVRLQDGAFAGIMGRFLGAFRRVAHASAQDPLRWLDYVAPSQHEVQRALQAQMLAGMIGFFLRTPSATLSGKLKSTTPSNARVVFEEPSAPDTSYLEEGGDPSWMKTHPQRNSQPFVLKALQKNPACLWYIDPALLQDAAFLETARAHCLQLDLSEAPPHVFEHECLLCAFVQCQGDNFFTIPQQHQTGRIVVEAVQRARCDGYDAHELGTHWRALLQHAHPEVLQECSNEMMRKVPELWAYLQIQGDVPWGEDMLEDQGTWCRLHEGPHDGCQVLQQVTCSPEEALAALEMLAETRPPWSPLEDPVRMVFLSRIDITHSRAAQRLLSLHRDFWHGLPREWQQDKDVLLLALTLGHEVWASIPCELWTEGDFVVSALSAAFRAQVSLAAAHPLIAIEGFWSSAEHLLPLFQQMPPLVCQEMWPYITPELWKNAAFVLSGARILDGHLRAQAASLSMQPMGREDVASIEEEDLERHTSDSEESESASPRGSPVECSASSTQGCASQLLLYAEQMRIRHAFWKNIAPELWKQREFVVGVAETDPKRALEAAFQLDPEFQEDLSFLHEILSRDGLLIRALPDRVLCNPELWKTAIQQNSAAFLVLREMMSATGLNFSPEQVDELYLLAVQSDMGKVQHLLYPMLQREPTRSKLLLELFRQRAVTARLEDDHGERVEVPRSEQDAAIVQTRLDLLTFEQWASIPDEPIQKALRALDYVDQAIFNSDRLCRLYCEVLMEDLSEEELQLVGWAGRGAPYQQEAVASSDLEQTKEASWNSVPIERRCRLERLHTALEAIPLSVWNSRRWSDWVKARMPDALLPRVPQSLHHQGVQSKIELWADEDFVLRVVQRYGALLERASDPLKQKPTICKLAVKQDWNALAFCRIDQIRHSEVPKSAVNQDRRALQWVDSRLSEYPQLVGESLETCPHLLAVVKAPYRSMLPYLKIVMCKGPQHLVHMSESAWFSICSASSAMREDGVQTPKRTEWIQLAEALLQARPSWFEHFPQSFQEDPKWRLQHLQALQSRAVEDPRKLTMMSGYEWDKIRAAWTAHQEKRSSQEEDAWMGLAEELLWIAPQHFGRFPEPLRNDPTWIEKHRLLVQAIRQNRESDDPLDLRDRHRITYALAHPEQPESQSLFKVIQKWMERAPEMFLACRPSLQQAVEIGIVRGRTKRLQALQACVAQDPRELAKMSAYDWDQILVAWNAQVPERSPEDQEWIELAEDLLWALPSFFHQFPDSLRSHPIWQEKHRLLESAIDANRRSQSSLDLQGVHCLRYAHAHPDKQESHTVLHIVEEWLQRSPEVFTTCPSSVRKDPKWIHLVDKARRDRFWRSFKAVSEVGR